MKPNPHIDSALHVLKGAVHRVLGATLTTSVYAEGKAGRLTVEYAGRPTEGQMKEVEMLANKKIWENVAIETVEMDRKEAEERFGRIIYDKFPVPEHIQKLIITHIRDWNINCCLGPHLATTGGIGRIGIVKWRVRESRKELEISFEVVF